MYKIPTLMVTALLFTACGGQGADAATDEAAAVKEETKAAQSKPSGRSSNAKWMISIDGLPEKSGKAITAVAMGGNGRYSLAGSDLTASIAVEQGNPASNMMINFNDANVRCFNGGDANLSIDGGRAVLSGEVQCYDKDAGSGAKAAARIEGWFELKK